MKTTKIISLLTVVTLFIISCGSPQSKWSKEEVSTKLVGCCFNGTDNMGGEQTTIFVNDGTWRTSTNLSGQPTYGEDNGTWSVGEFNKKHDAWEIDLHNGKKTELSTMGKKLYLSGWGSVYHSIKE